MLAVQPVLAHQHGDLTVGLELVIGGPGVDLRVPARVPPAAAWLLAGDDSAGTVKFGPPPPPVRSP